MTKKIWKFPLKAMDQNSIEMPIGAKILTVQVQGVAICIWVLCDPSAKKETRHFEVYGTGQEVIDDGTSKYLGTFQVANGEFVFHLFERY